MSERVTPRILSSRRQGEEGRIAWFLILGLALFGASGLVWFPLRSGMVIIERADRLHVQGDLAGRLASAVSAEWQSGMSSKRSEDAVKAARKRVGQLAASLEDHIERAGTDQIATSSSAGELPVAFVPEDLVNLPQVRRHLDRGAVSTLEAGTVFGRLVYWIGQIPLRAVTALRRIDVLDPGLVDSVHLDKGEIWARLALLRESIQSEGYFVRDALRKRDIDAAGLNGLRLAQKHRDEQTRVLRALIAKGSESHIRGVFDGRVPTRAEELRAAVTSGDFDSASPSEWDELLSARLGTLDSLLLEIRSQWVGDWQRRKSARMAKIASARRQGAWLAGGGVGVILLGSLISMILSLRRRSPKVEEPGSATLASASVRFDGAEVPVPANERPVEFETPEPFEIEVASSVAAKTPIKDSRNENFPPAEVAPPEDRSEEPTVTLPEESSVEPKELKSAESDLQKSLAESLKSFDAASRSLHKKDELTEDDPD